MAIDGTVNIETQKCIGVRSSATTWIVFVTAEKGLHWFMGENDTVASILINDRVDNYRNRLPAGFTRIQYIVILLNERCTGIELRF